MRYVTAVLGCAALVATLSAARASDIEVRQFALRATVGGLVLDADFAVNLTPRVVDLITNGVPVHFIVEFELSRPRWYWFDENTVSRRLQRRLSFHPLTRQYRLSTGAQQQSFDTLEDALHALMRVRDWLVVDRSVNFADASYEAAVRMRLDVTLLPKPFQLSALTDRDLTLESPWRRLRLHAPKHLPAPVETREPTGAR